MLENFSLRRKLALIALGPLVVFVVLLILGAGSELGIATIAIGFLVAALLAVLAVMAVAKGITGSLVALRDETTRVAQNDLPQLANSLRTGTPLPADFSEPRKLQGIGEDEFGEVATGLHSIRHSAVGIGNQAADLHSGIAETFVKLARSNQALLERQLEAIETLEAEEGDSDRLALMYRVDHLATRMRRNAESLLVLADAKSPERHGPAVELRDFLRVAIGEVEDYRRIVPIALDDLSVPGHRAQDLAHLLAELMENATQQSPPGTAVDVSGGYEPTTGDYIISILDKGTGIPEDKLAGLNSLLATPPSSTMTISHSIGLQVVSRLSHSIGIDVRLAKAPETGTLAAVRVPAALTTEWGGQAPATPATPQVAPLPEMIATPAPLEPAPLSGLAAEAPAAPDLGVPQVDLPTPDLGVPQVDLPTPDLGVPQVDLPAPNLGVPQVDLPTPDLAVPVAPAVPEAPAPIPDLGVPQVDLPAPDVGVPAPIPDLAAPVAPAVPEVPAPIPDLAAPVAPAAPEAPTFPAVTADPAPAPAAVTPPPAVAPQPEMPAPAPTTPEPIAAATPAPVAEKTSSGLTRRKRSAPSADAVDLNADRAAPSQRSPDQVRNMLSRYKTGLEKGRTGTSRTDGES